MGAGGAAGVTVAADGTDAVAPPEDVTDDDEELLAFGAKRLFFFLTLWSPASEPPLEDRGVKAEHGE